MENTEKDNVIQVYVDGSYNKDNNLTGAGIVLLYGGEIHKKAFIVDTEEDHSWNIDGECHATLEALKICSGEAEIDGKIIVVKNIVLNYDYMGIEKWATGEWKAKSKIAKLYSKEIRSIIDRNKLTVKFNKVKSHSGDTYNDIADGLAYNITDPKKNVGGKDI